MAFLHQAGDQTAVVLIIVSSMDMVVEQLVAAAAVLAGVAEVRVVAEVAVAGDRAAAAVTAAVLDGARPSGSSA
jgi:hypothetical protein